MIKRFFDNSIGFVMISTGVLIVAGMFIMMLFQACCSPSSKKKPDMRAVAKESLMLTAKNPESVRIIAFSEPDSVFGRNFFSDSELNAIYDNFSQFIQRTIDSSSDLDNPKVSAQIERGLAFSQILQEYIMPGMSDIPQDAEFSGWKMKVLYEYLNDYDEKEKNEKYLIFDKSQQHIIHSFDIPIL